MSQELNNKMLAYSGADKLYLLGYKGAGIKLMVLDTLSDPDKHGEAVIKANKVAGVDTYFLLQQSGQQAWKKAIDEKFDIVHISMTSFDKALSEEFVSKGGIVTCATGNRTTSDFSGWDHVIDVGAIWENLQVANYSASSETVDMVCFVPYVQRDGGSWFQQIGTSHTFIAGLTACLIQYWKAIGYRYTAETVKAYLLAHAVDILTPGRDDQSGQGYARIEPMNMIKAQTNTDKLVMVSQDGSTRTREVTLGARLLQGINKETGKPESKTVLPIREVLEEVEKFAAGKVLLTLKVGWEESTKSALVFVDTK